MCLPEVLTCARTHALTRSWQVTSQTPVSQDGATPSWPDKAMEVLFGPFMVMVCPAGSAQRTM